MLKRLFCSLMLVLAVGVSWSYAQQTPTTQGTEFWVSFMRNGYRNGTDEHLTLIASAKESCRVTVSNPHTGYSNSFTVQSQGVHTVEIPDNEGYNVQQAGNAFKGLMVTSTDTISLYIANEAQNSYDAANVLPVQALGNRYMVQSNKSVGEQSNHNNENRASFLIIATEDNTRVNITPVCQTWDNHPAGQTYMVTLQRGECYHVMNKNMGSEYNAEGDFSGTMIESLDETKPIAVFNGNCITSVPGGTTSGFDHVFEQAMPVDHWGKRFVVTSTNAPSSFNLLNDLVKITALNDNTIVWRNGTELCLLNTGESYGFEMNLNSEPCTFLESDAPIAVYLYNHSHRQSSPNGTTYGDPSMVWISPVEQTIREITFSTFQAANVEKHYVNVVCYTDHVSEIMYDNTFISNSFRAVPSAPEFSYARVEVPSGAHNIRCPGGFVAHVYGMGPNEGYAYTVGSSAKVLTTQLYINGESYNNYTEGYVTCQDTELQFSVETNFDIDHVIWNFTDGYSATGETISHSFGFPGTFQVEAFVYSNAEDYDVLLAEIHVSPMFEKNVSETTCEPFFLFHGNSYSVPCFEDVIVPGDEGCDTICHLFIMQGSSESFVTYDTACQEYEWFDTIRYASGTYVVVTGLPGGCDSIHLLHLTIGFPPDNPVRYVQSCSPYNWDDRVVCDTSGVYRLSFTTKDYCEYDSVLYFTRLFEAPFEQIMGLSQVAVATTFWPGTYNYYLDDSTGIEINRIHWELMGNPEGPGQWEFVPHGASCTITAYSMGERVLWVNSGDGPCGKEAYKVINCTGYGVGETEMVDLEVYPNPARDELVVKGPEILELTIYNLWGQKMRTMTTNGGIEVKVSVDDLPQALYLLEVVTPKGNKTRLVSVIR